MLRESVELKVSWFRETLEKIINMSNEALTGDEQGFIILEKLVNARSMLVDWLSKLGDFMVDMYARRPEKRRELEKLYAEVKEIASFCLDTMLAVYRRDWPRERGRGPLTKATERLEVMRELEKLKKVSENLFNELLKY